MASIHLRREDNSREIDYPKFISTPTHAKNGWSSI